MIKKILFILTLPLLSIGQNVECIRTIKVVERSIESTSPFENTPSFFEKIKPCAEQGNAKAQNYLGMFYFKGIGVEKDHRKAFKYISMGADLNYNKAQYNLARFYKYGIGCDINFKKAVEYYKLSSDNGNKQAAYSLGYMYYKGLGIKQDYSKAVSCFRKSATPIARHFLGLCYYFGYGVTQNTNTAIEYFSSNPTINSKMLLISLLNDKKDKQDEKIEAILTNDTLKDVILESAETIGTNVSDRSFYEENELELKNILTTWEGKILQYDWSSTFIRRVIPVELTIAKDVDTGEIKVKTKFTELEEVEDMETKAVWQDQMLYFEDPEKTFRLKRLYPESPNRLYLNYNILSLNLKEYNYNGLNHLIGQVDTYIPEWAEYGKPMSIVLAPKGNGKYLEEQFLLELAKQDEHFIKLYPVPFKDKLTVHYQIENKANVSAELVSLDGLRKLNILSDRLQLADSYTHTVTVNSSLPKGIYVVKVKVNGKLYTRLVIKED